MTNEEAIKRIKQFGLYHAIDDLPNSILTVQAFDMAIKALEMQIPKKPYRKIEVIENSHIGEYTYYHCDCPTCGEFIYGGESKHPTHCPCGQAIDWSEN